MKWVTLSKIFPAKERKNWDSGFTGFCFFVKHFKYKGIDVINECLFNE